MKRENQFDEVMIVNPSQGSIDSEQRVRLMRFHNVYPPDLRGYAEPEAYGYYAEPEAYGYYAEVDPTMGYYAEVDPMVGYYGEVDPSMGYYGEVDPTMGYYAEVDPMMGYYAEVDPTVGYYGEVDPTVGYYGEVDPTVGYYGQVDPRYGYYAQQEVAGVEGWDGYGYGAGESDPVGYYAEEMPLGYYGEGPNEMGYYGEPNEMVGYGEQEFAEEYPGVSDYGEPEYSGYVRENTSFNPGCPLPTNVNGYDEADLAGYSRPATVNPSCDQFQSQPGSPSSPPETFKPLW